MRPFIAELPAAIKGTCGEVAWLWRDEAGTATVEYALLVSIIVAGSSGAWVGLHAAVSNCFERVIDSLGGATEAP